MYKLYFRYTNDINVLVENDFNKTKIHFSKNGKEILYFKFEPYLREMSFQYGIFSDTFGSNKIICTAKDGGSFIARIANRDGFFSIRKKKTREQILFLRASHFFSNYNLKDKITDAACLLDGKVTRDKSIIEAFFDKREVKPFNEFEHLNSLNDEDKKYYLETEKINKVVEEIGKLKKLSSEEIETLSLYIDCLDEDSPLRNKVINCNDIEEVIDEVIFAKKDAKEYSNLRLTSNYTYEIHEYRVSDQFIFETNDCDDYEFGINKDEEYIYDLFYLFIEKYEDVKEYYEKSIVRIKETIDDITPYFEEFMKNSSK